MSEKRTYFPPTTAQQRKLLFESWEATGSIREACRKAHVGRGTFYYWKPRFDTDGYAGLESYAPKGPEKGYGRVSPEIEQKVLNLHDQHRDWGKHRLADEIAKLGPYEFICTGRPDEGIPAVCFKLKDGEDPGYTLYDLSERLRLRGWQVPAFTLGGEATDIVVMRIMCRRGFEMDFAELLLEDYKASLKYLSDHPKLQGIAQQNSFKHT